MKLFRLLTLPLLLVVLLSSAQTDTSEKVEAYEIYAISEQPSFPEGIEGFHRYIALNLTYPAEAIANSVGGKVFVQFVVDSTGQVKDAFVMTCILSNDPKESKKKKRSDTDTSKNNYGLDNAAMEVVRNSPAWIPGNINGKPVNVIMRIPIVFNIK